MAVSYKDINLLTQKSQVAGTEKLPVSDTQYITPNQIAGLVGSNFVDKTSDETVGGDKTFSDNVGVVDADHIVYSGGGGGGGFTRGYATASGDVATLQFSVSGEPKAFIITAHAPNSGASFSGALIIAIAGDSTGNHGVYTTGTQHNYFSGATTSYSNGTFSITQPTGAYFGECDYDMVYYYGSGTLTFKTSQIQPGSGVTAVTFTGTDLTEVPAMYACFLETQVNNESYRRVAYYTNESGGASATAKGVSFFSSQIHDTTASFTVTYQTGYSAGLNINSGGTNAGGYFHNPGTYVLYYLMASDIGGGGGGGFQSLGDELDDIRDTIGDIATILASI